MLQCGNIFLNPSGPEAVGDELGGAKRFCRCKRRWFGVSGSISLGSSLEEQIGRLFKINVTSANTVRNASKSTRALWLPRTAFIAFFTLLMSLSQTPDIWLVVGGWKCHSGSRHVYHSTSRDCNSLLMRSSLISWISRWSSFSAPVKFVLLSDHISFGQPRTEINRSRAWINEVLQQNLGREHKWREET